MIFHPEDVNSCLGVMTDACAFYTDPNGNAPMCLSVAVYQHQVEINLFVILSQPFTGDPTLDLNKELQQLEHLPSKKISIVDTIPQDHPAEIDSYYLKKHRRSMSLYWADSEHGLVIPLSHSTIDFDEYQSKLSELFAAVESPDENNALLLLKKLLPETRDYEKNMGCELVANATFSRLEDNRMLV